MSMKKNTAPIPPERIEKYIFLVRGQKIMLDKTLAELYGVATRVLNQAVKRNRKRFPSDFMVVLTRQEVMRMSQFVTSLKFSKRVHGFTEQGVAMLSTVLNSERAIEINIAIMRIFVKLRKMLAGNKRLAAQLAALERRIGEHDEAIRDIVTAIREMTDPPIPEKPRQFIGFHP